MSPYPTVAAVTIRIVRAQFALNHSSPSGNGRILLSALDLDRSPLLLVDGDEGCSGSGSRFQSPYSVTIVQVVLWTAGERHEENFRSEQMLYTASTCRRFVL